MVELKIKAVNVLKSWKHAVLLLTQDDHMGWWRSSASRYTSHRYKQYTLATSEPDGDIIMTVSLCTGFGTRKIIKYMYSTI